VEGLGEVGSKGLATLSGLERELGEAEMRAGLVREGLEVSIQVSLKAWQIRSFDFAFPGTGAGRGSNGGRQVGEFRNPCSTRSTAA
jgi:hypothetical protein